MKRNYQVDYNRYTFNADDDWGDYENGKYREGYKIHGGYIIHNYWCTDGKRHSMNEHIAKWEYFNERILGEMEIDHIIPISNGGTNKLSNLRLVTKKGNANNPMSIINKSNAQIKRWENEDERQKLKEKLKKRWENEDERQKYSEKFIGEKNPNYGNKWSDEQRLKASNFSKTNPRAIEHTYELNMAKRKPLIQIMPNGEKIEWESTREAGRNGYNQSCVASACRGSNNHYYKKCKWYYKDGEIKN